MREAGRFAWREAAREGQRPTGGQAGRVGRHIQMPVFSHGAVSPHKILIDQGCVSGAFCGPGTNRHA